MGILVGILCRIIMTFGIVIAKPVLTHSPIIMATTVRLLAANLTLGAAIIVSPQRKTLRTLFIPSKNWKFTLPASVLGAYLAMVLWIGGYKYIHASIAGILNQTATIFAIILAAILLKESFTKRKLVAVVLAMVGIVFVTLG